MSLVAVVGDVATTTATALAAAWPAPEPVVMLEADPSGGDLAAWFDLATSPGLASAVAAAPPNWPAVSEHVQHARGLEVLVAPGRATDADHVVTEAASRIVPILARLDDTVVLADCGSQHPARLSSVVVQAALVVVTIQPAGASDRAVAVRLDRHGELFDALTQRSIPAVAAVVTGGLYDPGEVAVFLGGGAGAVPVVEIASDPGAAAAIAGRAGSHRKVDRSPLMRTAAIAASELAARLGVGVLGGVR